MTKQQQARMVQQVARYFVAQGERPTVVEVARYAEGYRYSELTSLSDTAFSRFVAQVQREVASLLREADDMARVLGR